MIVATKNNTSILLRRLTAIDFEQLVAYLQHLSIETKMRFGPHPFDKQSIINFYQNAETYFGYVAINNETNEMIAYSIIKTGYLEHDRFRLESYGITLDKISDCTFAPSVTDRWQSAGIGKRLFQFMLDDLKKRQLKRIILWGGVKTSNEKAVNYYVKNGFKKLGQFQYNGENYDMIFVIS